MDGTCVPPPSPLSKPHPHDASGETISRGKLCPHAVTRELGLQQVCLAGRGQEEGDGDNSAAAATPEQGFCTRSRENQTRGFRTFCSGHGLLLTRNQPPPSGSHKEMEINTKRNRNVHQIHPTYICLKFSLFE